jgi:hypothetical protein
MKLKVQAQHLQPGDIVGSGEKVVRVSAGVRTPRGKVDVVLDSADFHRCAVWGRYTMIGIERVEG